MGRYGIKNVRESSMGSDAATKGYTDRAITPLSTKIDELSTSAAKLDGSTSMTKYFYGNSILSNF